MEFQQTAGNSATLQERSSRSVVKFSVVIPFFNRFETILSTLESVKQQSNAVHEIILVDDASVYPIGHLVGHYDKIRIIRNSSNRGPSYSRNIGAAAASGDWIAFLDSDDAWHPDYLLECRNAIAIAKSETALIYADTQYRSASWLKGCSILGTNIFGSCSCVVIRRDIFNKTDGFDERIKFAEDWKLWIQISRLYPTIHIRRPLVLYARNSVGSLTSQKNLRKPGYVAVRAARKLRDRQLSKSDRIAWRQLLVPVMIANNKLRSARTLIISMIKIGAPVKLIAQVVSTYMIRAAFKIPSE